jgi:hypothetical protein
VLDDLENGVDTLSKPDLERTLSKDLRRIFFLNETTLVMHPGGLHSHKRMQLIRKKKILENLNAERRKKVPSCRNL